VRCVVFVFGAHALVSFLVLHLKNGCCGWWRLSPRGRCG
jgi:hypothetical protein